MAFTNPCLLNNQSCLQHLCRTSEENFTTAQQASRELQRATATPHTGMLLASLLTLLKGLLVGFLSGVEFLV